MDCLERKSMKSQGKGKVVRLGDSLQNEEIKDLVDSYVLIVSQEIFNENLLYLLVCYILKNETNGSKSLAKAILEQWIEKSYTELKNWVADNPPVYLTTEEGYEVSIDSVIFDYINSTLKKFAEDKRKQLRELLDTAFKD